MQAGEMEAEMMRQPSLIPDAAIRDDLIVRIYRKSPTAPAAPMYPNAPPEAFAGKRVLVGTGRHIWSVEMDIGESDAIDEIALWDAKEAGNMFAYTFFTMLPMNSELHIPYGLPCQMRYDERLGVWVLSKIDFAKMGHQRIYDLFGALLGLHVDLRVPSKFYKLRDRPLPEPETEPVKKRSNPCGIRFLSMFHMSNDSHLFKTREKLEGEGYELEGNHFVKPVGDSFSEDV